MITKITCIADILAHTPRVRVIKENDTNYGKEFNIVTHNYSDKQLSITDKPGNYCVYQYSEIQFLTPVQYEWRYIGLWDKVNDWEVFDYVWHNGKLAIRMAMQYDYDDCDTWYGYEITSFEPLHQLIPKIELSTEELVEELRRRGVVTSGDIIKN